jgi:hypothetical protein
MNGGFSPLEGKLRQVQLIRFVIDYPSMTLLFFVPCHPFYVGKFIFSGKAARAEMNGGVT